MIELPKVAILLAAYNGQKWLEEQIMTILNQKKIMSTIYVSIDLSTDGTHEIFKQLALTSNKIEILPYGDYFGGASPNFYRLIRDVDFSAYDYVAFADQDDVWLEDKISHGINQMHINSVDAYSANVVAFWENGREKLIDKSQPQRELDYLFEAAGPGCTYIFTTKAAALIKHYLKTFPELNDFILHDWLSYAILRHNKYSWFIDPIAKMRYRQHGNNQVGANTSLKGKIYRARYILSGQAFKSVTLLIRVFNMTSVELASRKGISKLALKARQLRRRYVDQLFIFIALCLYGIKGPK